jgi:ABC-type nickel/cobalt efflux system permease component RcnA
MPMAIVWLLGVLAGACSTWGILQHRVGWLIAAAAGALLTLFAAWLFEQLTLDQRLEVESYDIEEDRCSGCGCIIRDDDKGANYGHDDGPFCGKCNPAKDDDDEAEEDDDAA